ncbi:hypothetical protein CBOM_00471 [Ceraceosorus bombacis]|uniref:Uncharacterized protein n=1 Tax=Ceraceosorus bombacis TaxID=401625 RepID=A0A0P1A432_9BASI|nr:hypothetical protein CBOM_00471 [Ceraceosorus bombacis]
MQGLRKPCSPKYKYHAPDNSSLSFESSKSEGEASGDSSLLSVNGGMIQFGSIFSHTSMPVSFTSDASRVENHRGSANMAKTKIPKLAKKGKGHQIDLIKEIADQSSNKPKEMTAFLTTSDCR